MYELLFLIAPIDPVVAVGVASALVTTVGVLWRRNLIIEERSQKNQERMIDALHASSSAINALTRAIERSNESNK